jgi:hypothetical protein
MGTVGACIAGAGIPGISAPGITAGCGCDIGIGPAGMGAGIGADIGDGIAFTGAGEGCGVMATGICPGTAPAAAGRPTAVAASVAGSRLRLGSLSAGMTIFIPHSGQTPFFPARNDFTFSLCPLGQ